MDSTRIDKLNVVLILLSLLLSFIIPFELFLFSYAVLGPLHYLTEINWLHEKKYFVDRKKFVYILFIPAILFTITAIWHLKIPASFANHAPGWISNIFSTTLLPQRLVLIAFIFAIGLMYFKKKSALLVFFLVSLLLISLLTSHIPGYLLLMAAFIPTIIHVYLFTLLFMIFGTLNKKTTAGITAIVLLALCPFIILLIPVEIGLYPISDHVQSMFRASGFQSLNKHIALVLGVGDSSNYSVLSAAGIKIQVFIAFAYTYHYLNWFSKTTVIGWHKNLRGIKPFTLLLLWVISLCLYAYDYRTGLTALLFLSILHVFVEFPLNIVSIKAIARKLF